MKKHWILTAPRRGVDLGIRAYQRHLSPLKGFTCAHLVAEGGVSCSAAIRTIIQERGVVGGIVPTLARFVACGQAAWTLRQSPTMAQGICCCGGIPIPFRF